MAETNVTTVVSGEENREQTLIVVFLRGGADGLNLVAPVEDDDYFRSRPTIGLGAGRVLKLDDLFGLNPLMTDLMPLYKEGLMSIVHCVGSEDGTRSHFEAQDLMDHGGLVAGGWLGRYLRATQPRDGDRSPLSAVAIGTRIPENLRGAPSATAIRNIEEFSLGKKAKHVGGLLGKLYENAPSELLQRSGAATMAALEKIDTLTSSDYKPSNGAEYGDDSFSKGMRQIAQLIKARVGVEAATLDLGGWDSHLTSSAVMDPEIRRLNSGLSAFCNDMGKEMSSTTVVVMTEFGRRVQENSALGTDHGRGSVMFVLGGGHKGGRIRVDWPGLKAEVLEGPGDLPVLTNYRDVIAPILTHISPDVTLESVFPQFKLQPLNLFG